MCMYFYNGIIEFVSECMCFIVCFVCVNNLWECICMCFNVLEYMFGSELSVDVYMHFCNIFVYVLSECMFFNVLEFVFGSEKSVHVYMHFCNIFLYVNVLLYVL